MVDDPYLLSGTPPVADVSFARPLAVLYAIGANALAEGFVLHHRLYERATISVPLDASGGLVGRVVGPVRPERGSGIVLPTSGRTSNTFPHLGADALNKFMFDTNPKKGQENREAAMAALTGLPGGEALAFRAFLARLFELAARTTPLTLAAANHGAVAVLADPVLVAFIELTGFELAIGDDVDSLANALLIPVDGTSGLPFATLPSWRARHVEAVRATLPVSKKVGVCSITGERRPLLSTMPNSISQSLKALTGRPNGSAAISGNSCIVSGRGRVAGVGEARISLDAGEKISVGLVEVSTSCELSLVSDLYRSTIYYEGVNNSDRPSLVVLLTTAGDDPARRLLVGLRNALTSLWIKASTDADGNRVAGRYGKLDALDLGADSRIVAASMNGSKAGVSLTRWAERDALLVADRVNAWAGGQHAAGQRTVWAVDRIARCFPAASVRAFTRFLLDDVAIPLSLVRFGIVRLAHVFSTGAIGASEPERRVIRQFQRRQLSELHARRELTGAWLVALALHSYQIQRRESMTGLRDTPAFRLGAWFAAIQQAWEGSVNRAGDKQSLGPARHLPGLLASPAERWIQVETQYQRAVAPLLKADTAKLARLVESRASRYLVLDTDVPIIFDETDQCRFLLGFHSRWEPKTAEQTDSDDPLTEPADDTSRDDDETAEDGETE